MPRLPLLSLCLSASLLAACGETPVIPQLGYGPAPELPEPDRQLIPTVHIAEARGWPEGAQPVAAQGLQVQAFARDLAHPRWLLVLPNGDVLVAESNKPAKPVEGFKGWIMERMMTKAGAGVPSADRISLLRDTDGDGVADLKTAFLENLHSPFGMALVGDQLFVANTDAVLRFPYQEGQTQIDEPGSKVIELPAGPINHHWTKNLIPSPDGSKLYVTTGSNSNIGENGMDAEEGRAAIWEVDIASGQHRIFASGLRNPNGLGWEPDSGALWVAVNERDALGDDLVPDYITSVRDGGFYGWPYSYFGQHLDERVKPQRPELVATAIAPDYAVGAHTASLGIAFADRAKLGEGLSSGLFIGQHGSWNRKPRSGYKVIFVPFRDGQPDGMPIDVLDGFLSEDGKALGRPVDVRIDRSGALLVSDDVGNSVWRVSRQP